MGIDERSHECKQAKLLTEDEDAKMEDTMDDCESAISFEGQGESMKELNSESVNKMNENVMQQDVALGEVNSPHLKTNHPAEPNYRFGNRRKAGSFLSISRKDYQDLANGKSLSYVNSKSGSLMTIRIVSKDRKQPQEYGGRELERVVPSMPTVINNLEDFDGMDNIISHESLMAENSPNISMEEVADNAELIAAKEKNQADSAACSQMIRQVPSHFSSKHGKPPVNAVKRRRKISTPKTLYGAGKRAAQKRSTYTEIPNLFACRFRAGMKRKFATLPSDTLPKKKMIPESCFVQSCFVSESSCINKLSSYAEFPTSRTIASASAVA